MEIPNLTKQELVKIIKDTIAEECKNSPNKGINTIFQNVKITGDDFKYINNKFNVPEQLFRTNVNQSAPLNISYDQFHRYIRSDYKSQFVMHDNLRILTQRICGASRNSEIEKIDYDFAEECYAKLKRTVLELYEKRLERLLSKKD